MSEHDQDQEDDSPGRARSLQGGRALPAVVRLPKAIRPKAAAIDRMAMNRIGGNGPAAFGMRRAFVRAKVPVAPTPVVPATETTLLATGVGARP
jgi:hypothetical protein